MVSPSGRVPERALDWFFVATEACGGGTPDLGLFLEFSLFIGGFGVGDKSRGSTRWRQGKGRALGGAPPTLVVASGLLSVIFSLQYFFLFSKNILRKFSAHSENFYFCTKNDTTVVLIKSYQNHIKLL
jgi:hypothetical protein